MDYRLLPCCLSLGIQGSCKFSTLLSRNACDRIYIIIKRVTASTNTEGVQCVTNLTCASCLHISRESIGSTCRKDTASRLWNDDLGCSSNYTWPVGGLQLTLVLGSGNFIAVPIILISIYPVIIFVAFFYWTNAVKLCRFDGCSGTTNWRGSFMNGRTW